MGITAIIPVYLQVETLVNTLCTNLRTLLQPEIARVVVICNRLSLMPAWELGRLLAQISDRIAVLHDKERSVAGAWNRGIEFAQAEGSEYFLITAIDVSLFPGTAEVLLRFGETHRDADIWSSTEMKDSTGGAEESTSGCDCSCVMLRTRTIERYGWFD
jgi:GT2 family glycosyltransferase